MDTPTPRNPCVPSTTAVARDQSPARGPASPRPTVVLIAALNIEVGGVVDRMTARVTTHCATYVEHLGRYGDYPLLVVESGVGSVAAARVTEDVLRVHQPRGVFSVGFAGALRPELLLHQIILPTSVTDANGPPLQIGFDPGASFLAAHPHVHRGRLATVDQLVRTPAERDALARSHEALVCDMETYAVARVCQTARVPFLSVRVISDRYQDMLPADLTILLQQKTAAGRWGAAAGALLRNPKQIKDLWRLREQAIQATDQLAHFLRDLLPYVLGPAHPQEST